MAPQESSSASAPIIDQTEPDPSLPFAALYSHQYGEHTRNQWQQAWEQCIEHWLGSRSRGSENTQRAYRRNLALFQEFLSTTYSIVHLWRVAPAQVNGWVHVMSHSQLSEATINQRLATLSSLYKYAVNTTTIISGREISLLIDAHGNTRINPFTATSVQRPKITPYGKAIALPVDAYSWIINDLQERNPTIKNLRNLAMLLMYGLNGWRANEVLTMQWQYIHKGENQYIYEWTGKGCNGERSNRALPTHNYNAIIAYLTMAGRYYSHLPDHPDQIQGEEYLWQPVANIKRNNFTNANEAFGQNRHINRASATGMLQRHLGRYFRHLYRQAGHSEEDAAAAAVVEAKKYTLHSLRHMAAQQLYAGSNYDLKCVQELMNHKSIATTQLYLENMKVPNEKYSPILSRQLSLKFPT